MGRDSCSTVFLARKNICNVYFLKIFIFANGFHGATKEKGEVDVG